MNSKRHPLYIEIYNEIRDNIVNGIIPKNTKIDSVRQYSVKRGISTTTVEKAYNQLVIEGYIISRPRSGFIVVDIHQNKSIKGDAIVDQISFSTYRNNNLSEDLFDMKTYKSIINKIINYQSSELYKPCDPRGELQLRTEIQKYVLSERNINCDVNQIVIGPGIQNLLQMLLLLEQRKTVGFLEPMFRKAVDIFKMNNYVIQPAKNVQSIIDNKSDFLYISPSNIYPTGDVIKVNERYELLKWAKKNKTYIIEDDYNFFIRYNSFTIPSIYSFDNNENVIYMGSFSKTILPSIRLSYMILPIPLYNKFKESYLSFGQGVSKLEQLSLALYMKEGLFKRHTKKLYTLYKEKNECILKELEKYDITVSGTDSNLHVIIEFKEHQLLVSFMKHCSLSNLQYETIKDSLKVIFPYSGLNVSEIPEIIKSLFQ